MFAKKYPKKGKEVRRGKSRLQKYMIAVIVLLLIMAIIFISLLLPSSKKISPIVVTLVDQKTVDTLAGYVGAYHRDSIGGPRTKIAVYGLNLLLDQKERIRHWQDVEFFDVLSLRYSMNQNPNFVEEMPESVESLSSAKWHHFWQLLVINHAAKEYDAVVFVSVDYHFIGLDRLKEDHLFVTVSRGEAEGKCGSEVIGLVNEGTAHNMLIKPMVECYLKQNCFDMLWEKEKVGDYRLPGTGTGTPYPCTIIDDIFSIGNLGSDLSAYLRRTDGRNIREEEAKEEAVHLINEHPKNHFRHYDEVDKSISNFDQILLEEADDDGKIERTHVGGKIMKPESGEPKKSGPWTMALLVISTTNGIEKDKGLLSLPIFDILLDSFRKTVDKNDKNFHFRLYLGYDEGDQFYDGEENQKKFETQLREYMKGYDISYKGIRYPPKFKGYTSGMWSVLALEAYDDGMDFLYQLNDDIEFLTNNWASELVNPLINANPPMFGVTGPVDVGYPLVLTQAVVHRSHVEIFGCFMPGLIRNWYGRDKQNKQDELHRKEKRIMAAETALEKVLSSCSESERLSGRVSEIAAEDNNLTKEIDELKAGLQPIQTEIQNNLQSREKLRDEWKITEQSLQSELTKYQNSVVAIASNIREIQKYMKSNKERDLNNAKNRVGENEENIGNRKASLASIQTQISEKQKLLSNKQLLNMNIHNNIEYRHKFEAIEGIDKNVKNETDRIKQLEQQGKIDTEFRGVESSLKKLSEEIGNVKGKQESFRDTIADANSRLRQKDLQSVDIDLKKKLVERKTCEMAGKDMEKYYTALDRSLMKHHTMKMEEINKIINEYWQQVYRGQDIESIKITSDVEGTAAQATSGKRSYKYRVVMLQNGRQLDMRGRCSAGQKVIASLIIRLALAETFCLHAGVLALDEPTTNLDRENAESFAAALASIIKTRQDNNTNFQIVVITHDLEFSDSLLAKVEYTDKCYQVRKDPESRQSVIEVHRTAAAASFE